MWRLVLAQLYRYLCFRLSNILFQVPEYFVDEVHERGVHVSPPQCSWVFVCCLSSSHNVDLIFLLVVTYSAQSSLLTWRPYELKVPAVTYTSPMTGWWLRDYQFSYKFINPHQKAQIVQQSMHRSSSPTFCSRSITLELLAFSAHRPLARYFAARNESISFYQLIRLTSA